MKMDKESGVISLEACILVPMFIMMLMFIYGFFVHFMGHNMMSHALMQSAKSLSLDGFSISAVSNMSNSSSSSRAVPDLFQLGTTIGDGGAFNATEAWYDDESKVDEEVEERFMAFLAGDASATDIADYFDLIGVSNLDFSDSKVENGDLTIVVKYEQEFIYDFGGFGVFDCELSYKVKMWEDKKI